MASGTKRIFFLELIREKLVWVEQPKADISIYLQALTDEPAEQAVQKAIEASGVEADSERTAVRCPVDYQTQQPIPIAELPPKSRPSVLHKKNKENKIKPAKDNK